MSPDVWIGDEPFVVHRDEMLLEHVPSGALLFGDDAILRHVCVAVSDD